MFRVSAFLLVGAAILKADIVGWRNDGTSRFPDAHPPLTWSAESNIVWKTKLPNLGNSSPIMVGKRIFVCAEPATLICLDARNGVILWTATNTYEMAAKAEELADMATFKEKTPPLRTRLHGLEGDANKLRKTLKDNPADADAQSKLKELDAQIATLKQEVNKLEQAWYAPPVTHDVNGFSSPTPSSEGKRVYVLYGTGVAAAYDLDGKRRWIKFLEKPVNGWGHSASPLLADGKLILHIRNVFALDPATGNEIWKTPSPEHWGSPILAHVGKTPVVVTAHGDILRASDGVRLAEKIFPLTYCTPLNIGNRLYFIENNGKCVELPPEIVSNRAPVRLVWITTPKSERYYASPLYHDGLIYAVMQHGHLSVIDAETGQVIGEKKFAGGTFYSSICSAGGNIFVSNESGTTTVFKPGKSLEEIAVNKLESFRTTPLFAGDRIFIRGLKNMYCIGLSGSK